MKLRKILSLLMCLILCLSLLTGCGKKEETPPADDVGKDDVPPAENVDPVPAGPTEEEMTLLADISKAGAKPVKGDKLKEGTYDIQVASGSALFRILESKLVVVGKLMQLVLKVEGDAYSRMYAGSAAEAAAADKTVEGEKGADGNTTFRIVVKSLNEVLTCSAYADSFGKWFDRTIFPEADSLPKDAFKTEEPKPDEPKPDPDPQPDPNPEPDPDPDPEPGLEDGDYPVKVTLTGGTGKAYIHSPATLHVTGGKMTVTIKWSSENYDYMIVGGKKYLPESVSGGSVFTIPVKKLGKSFKIIADTTAMSAPHEIEYKLRLDLI